jgi:DNA-binding CsgD family transcriptional regulator
MDIDACSKLTEMQMTCLRLVGRGLSSKEIARETDLTHQTVDQYLSKATALLGASNRRDAARRFADWEQFKNPEFKSMDLADSPPAAILDPTAKPRGWPQAEGSEQVMRDSAAGASMSAASPGWPVAVPPVGGEANGLTSKQRLYAILRIAAFSAIAMLAIVLVLTGTLNLIG